MSFSSLFYLETHSLNSKVTQLRRKFVKQQFAIAENRVLIILYTFSYLKIISKFNESRYADKVNT